MLKPNTCGTCLYAHTTEPPNIDPNKVSCRRYPQFIFLNADDWCGEYAKGTLKRLDWEETENGWELKKD